MKKIVIAGGSGYIGSSFQKKFKDKYQIKILTRSPKNIYDINELEDCDIIINLAGETIFPNRWTKSRKAKLQQSRYFYSKELLEAAEKFNVSHYVQASAISYYPPSKTKIYSEDDVIKMSANFSSKLVHKWESSINFSSNKNYSLLRIGPVIGSKSNFVIPLFLQFNNFLGGNIGSGEQILSWIHIEDVIDSMEFVINKKIFGPVNLVSPNPVTNHEMSEMIARVLHRPNYLHLPEVFYKTLFGNASELLLEGQNVEPKKLLKSGFNFKFSDFSKAFKDSI